MRCGKNREAHDIFKAALILFGIIGLVGSSILFFGARAIADKMGNSDVEGIMVALSPAIFFVAISAVVRGYFNGMYNMKVSSHSQIIEQFFKSAFTILLVVVVYYLTIANPSAIAQRFQWSEENVTVVMATVANAASTIAAAIGLFYLFIYYQRTKKEIWKNINSSKGLYVKEQKWSIMKKILAVSIPISLASIVAAINRNIDTFTVMNGLKVALQGMMNSADAIKDEATRLYGILSGRVDTLIGLPTALNVAFSTALVPAVSEAMANKDEKTARRRITFSVRTTLLIALPCAIGMCVLANPILHLLFPNVQGEEAELLLQISSFTVIFTLLNQTIAGALQGLGKVVIPALSLACGAAVKLILNLILIPNPAIGVYGASVSSVVASMIATFIELIVLNKNMKFDANYFQIFGKPILAVSVMGIITYYFHSFFETYIRVGAIATIVSIALAVVVYLLAILGFKIFDREDYHMLPYGDKIYGLLQKMKLVK